MSDVKTQWRFPGDELPWARELNRSKESIARPSPEFRLSLSIPWDSAGSSRRVSGGLRATPALPMAKPLPESLDRSLTPSEATTAQSAFRLAETRLMDEDVSGLVDQVVRRLARGHYKVAVRRALMHYAGGGELPRHILQKLNRAAARCKEREIQGMWLEAVLWAEFARPWGRRDAVPCPLPIVASSDR